MIAREDWKGLNFKTLKKRRKELEEFEEYIPLIFHNHISSINRMEYLKKQGLYSKMEKKTTVKRLEFRKAEDKSEWVIKDILTWVNKNQSFTDLINTKIKE